MTKKKSKKFSFKKIEKLKVISQKLKIKDKNKLKLINCEENKRNLAKF